MVKVLNVVFIIGFLFFAWFPTLSMFFQAYSTQSYSENRNLTRFPDLTETKLKLLPSALHSFYDDHFGFRNTMLLTKIRIRERLSIRSNVYVFEGKNGFSFLDPIRPKHSNSNLTYKTIFFTTEELRTVKNELEKENLWFETRSIPYLLVIAPDKEALYPEYFPYPTILSNLRLYQLESYLAQNSTVRLFDLRKALADAKREGIYLYYKGDYHWNQYGALLGYIEIMRKLKETHPGAYVPEPSDFEIAPLKGETLPAIDLSLFASLDDASQEKFKIVPRKDFAGKDKRLKKVFLYGDSFGKNISGDSVTGLVSYLPFSFEDVHFEAYITDEERSKGALSPLEYNLIEKEKPDLVIRETIQRNVRVLLGPEYSSF